MTRQKLTFDEVEQKVRHNTVCLWLLFIWVCLIAWAPQCTRADHRGPIEHVHEHRHKLVNQPNTGLGATPSITWDMGSVDRTTRDNGAEPNTSTEVRSGEGPR